MATQSKHNAAGQMAGYLFQPERALWHLGKSNHGAIVGIETLDDVAVLTADGKRILEQDKHYVSSQTPLADRSKEFWNSLLIWLDINDAGDLDLDNTQLYLVTNQSLKAGIVLDLKNMGRGTNEVQNFVSRLRKAGKKPPKHIKHIVYAVLKRSDAELIALISRIYVYDSSSAMHGDALKIELRDHMHMPAAHAEEIIQGLSGWVEEQALTKIRNKEPAWITRAAFTERYLRLLYRYQDIAFVRETEEALIHVSEEDRIERKEYLFVKQLQWVGCSESDEDNQILEAIDAHIRSGTEAARLAQLGIVSLQEFSAFDQRLLSRWKQLRRMVVPKSLPQTDDEQEEIGRRLLNQTLNHREPLAGQQTSEFYLTHGAYHRLADTPPNLGWHPKFEEKVKRLFSSQNAISH